MTAGLAGALGLALLGAGAAAPAASSLRAGLLLYAAPGAGDPRFAESVVLLVRHERGGSLGLMINQPTDLPVRERLPRLDAPRGMRLHYGGPVEPSLYSALLRSPQAIEGALQVVPGVYFTTSEPVLAQALARKDPSAVRVYSGYAGWGAGQLAGEMKLGGWVTARADAATIFSDEPDSLWPRVYELLRRIEARAAP